MNNKTPNKGGVQSPFKFLEETDLNGDANFALREMLNGKIGGYISGDKIS